MNTGTTNFKVPGTPWPHALTDFPHVKIWGKHSAPDIFTDLHAIGDMVPGWFSYIRHYGPTKFTAYGRRQNGDRIPRRDAPAHAYKYFNEKDLV